MDQYSIEQLRLVLHARAADWPNTSAFKPISDAGDPLADVPSAQILREIRTRQKGIYGDDNRVEVYQSAPAQKQRAMSVAAIFDVDDLTPLFDGRISIPTRTMAEKFDDRGAPLCGREPFRDQPAGAFCSAFLVAPSVVATAGHCIDEDNYYTRRFIFDFESREAGAVETIFPASAIYAATRYLAGRHTWDGADWALVELDRPVKGRPPLPLRRSGKVAPGAPVYVIGHPAGLPKKVAGNAQVRDNSLETHFVANLDTYGGNSGSPVFNAVTHEVEGILVRGETDFAPLGDCVASLVCPVQGCAGEECTRITLLTAALAAHLPG